MKKNLLYIIVATLGACTQPQTGPCDYNITDTYALITKIQQDGESNKFDVVLKFYGTGLAKGEHLLTDFKNVTVDSAFIQRNKLAVNNKLHVTVSERADNGSCEQFVVAFNHKLR